MPVYKYLDISTAHAPNPAPGFGDLRVLDDEYGWVVFVPSAQSAQWMEWPPWINDALQLAWDLECDVISFDRDASIDDRIPNWEW